MLLTAPDELPSAVATFLARPAITTVYIVGNEEVVSAAVEVVVAAINGVTVNRIASVDTAAAAAVEIAGLVGWTPGSPGEIPGRGRTALLATGENFADALAAGPLAYRGDHPILLTPASELPAAVATFLRDSLTDHVVILGGTAAVSAAVDNSVKGLGITTQRWQGADRFATAIDIAEQLLGANAPQQCFDDSGDDSGDVGLAYGWRSPDAIVSGPLLGELCAPLLLTERNTLSSTVTEFLRSDDYVTGDAVGKLRITVFGGTAAVGSRALDSATRAATLVALGATLEAFDGGCHVAVTFAAPVRTADATNVANYFNGNVPFRPEELEGLIDADGDGATDFALDGFAFGDSDVIFVDGEPDGSDAIEPDRAVCDTITPGVRPGTLVARVQSGRSDGLPSTQSSAFVRSGAITDLAGNPNIRQTVSRFGSP